jgi:hypothetical protein
MQVIPSLLHMRLNYYVRLLYAGIWAITKSEAQLCHVTFRS